MNPVKSLSVEEKSSTWMDPQLIIVKAKSGDVDMMLMMVLVLDLDLVAKHNQSLYFVA